MPCQHDHCLIAHSDVWRPDGGVMGCRSRRTDPLGVGQGPNDGTKLDLIMWQLLQLSQQLGEIMTAQGDITAAVTAFTALLTDMQSDSATLLTDVTAIQAQLAAGQPVDTSALDSVVASVQAMQTGLDTAVSQVSGLVPAPPAAT
jgi:hypothetical protein